MKSEDKDKMPQKLPSMQRSKYEFSCNNAYLYYWTHRGCSYCVVSLSKTLYPMLSTAKGQLSKNNLRKIAIIFFSISLNMCFGCSKEPSHRDGSFEYPQHMFWMGNKDNGFTICTLIGRPVYYRTHEAEYLCCVLEQDTLFNA